MKNQTESPGVRDSKNSLHGWTPPHTRAEFETRIAEAVAALEEVARALRERRSEIGGERPPVQGPLIPIPSPLARARVIYAAFRPPAPVLVLSSFAALDPDARPLPAPSFLVAQPPVLRHPATHDEVRRRAPQNRR